MAPRGRGVRRGRPALKETGRRTHGALSRRTPSRWTLTNGFFAPLDAGAVLVREERFLTASFGMIPPYLTTTPDRYQFYVHGLEQSRRFRALKIWMSFKRYGAEEIGRWIDRNIAHAEQLDELAAQDPAFERVHPPVMSTICLRYRDGDLGFHQRGGRRNRNAAGSSGSAPRYLRANRPSGSIR